MSEIEQLLAAWKKDEEIGPYIQHIEEIPAKKGKTVPFPKELHPSLRQALEKKGITALYTHQYEAYTYAQQKQSFTAVTPTASGKSLAYHLPVLQEIMNNSASRALYLFPTKALAQDQRVSFHEFVEASGEAIYSYTYDGDTSPGIRRKVRQAGHVVMTNPDMLHSGILPHHTKWVSLFENLKFVVIDELHTYKGVFGSHVAHVIRRLKRICHYYGSDPTFICTSATIENPLELAENLTNESMACIDQNGAPIGKKYIVFYNPPVIHPTFGIRKSAVHEVEKLARSLYQQNIQTIIFARSRVRVEMIVTYLQQLTKQKLFDTSIMGYRGGYLPSERRTIEKGLRDGSIQTVVSTNALELGVDIGSLQAAIMTGYPGNISSALQQAGRAGRRGEDALVVYVAQSLPLDQYVVHHPDYLLQQRPESVRIEPANIMILMDHLKCAAFELPFTIDEMYGEYDVQELLHYLSSKGILLQTGVKWYWMTDEFPASNVSLRSASQENVVIIDQTVSVATRVIGEMDRFSAMTLLHEEAIYLHQGKQFQVEKLDWEEKKAYVKEVDVDYFTDAQLAVDLKVLDDDRQKRYEQGIAFFGDVAVIAKPTIFKKIRFGTHDNIGSGPIYLPEEELHTSSTWFSFQRPVHWSEAELSDVLINVAYALEHLIPLLVSCDRSDIHVVPKVKATETEEPTIFIYDRYPGGIGLSEKVFDRWPMLLQFAARHVEDCPCDEGCPSCIGAMEEGQSTKERVHQLLMALQS